jgi:isopenicillin-N N-acyltransferase like protein
VSADLEPVMFDQPSGLERGRAHGELWRAEIHELAALRLALCLRAGGFASADQVLGVARAHLPVLREQAPELYDELLGIADAADLAIERLVVLNHYTDLAGAGEDDFGGGTAVYTHGVDGPLLGQTWDMHASAEPFVRMIAVRSPDGQRETLCFTVTGCLGLAGLGHEGVAVTSNGLSFIDARVGLVWPALIRQLLDAPDADAALARLRSAPIGGGRHIMIADGQRFHGVECSGELEVLTQKGARAAHLHTNHCFDPVLRQRERVPARSSTFNRLNMATTLYAQQRPTTFEALWALLGSHDGHPRSICSHLSEQEGDLSHSATCGRMLMRPLDGVMRVARGCSRTGRSLDLCSRAPSRKYEPAAIPQA